MNIDEFDKRIQKALCAFIKLGKQMDGRSRRVDAYRFVKRLKQRIATPKGKPMRKVKKQLRTIDKTLDRWMAEKVRQSANLFKAFAAPIGSI